MTFAKRTLEQRNKQLELRKAAIPWAPRNQILPEESLMPSPKARAGFLERAKAKAKEKHLCSLGKEAGVESRLKSGKTKAKERATTD